MDQRATPVLDAVAAHPPGDHCTFRSPGRGGGFEADQAVRQAEALLADATGARDAVFTACGCDVSMLAAVLAVAGPGDRVLIDRNVHKSVVSALVLAGADPVWLRPCWNQRYEMWCPARAEEVAGTLAAEGGITAVVVRTPTVYGTGAHTRALARACHRHGVSLLVDESGGAHFAFHPDLPTPATLAGADLAVVGVHAGEGDPCQASVLFSGGDADSGELRRRLDLLTAGSRNTAAYAMIDGFRRRMVVDGRRLLGDALHRVNRLRARLERTPGLAVLDESVLGHDGVAQWDPLRLAVDVSGLGISGYHAQAAMARDHGITVELADARRLILPITYADGDDVVDRLLRAFTGLAGEPPAPHHTSAHAVPPALPELERVMPLRDAYFAESEPVAEPAGRVSAEMISPSPPGAPVVLPGERLTEEMVWRLRTYVAAGTPMEDASDPRLSTFRVVRNRTFYAGRVRPR